ncbi:PIN domain-containing protein [Rhodanobacter denitrificans]|uniref:PIN domain-containing protein n=1 Tax=Rhodanobacter denitrificans TaxID=666685 RepID=A0A368KI48_9GAMM|nr:PIN domain-containing protein [Rhodanobacter denitrificans]RCS31580.1 PIN domain-containing protein [Rhodanobacter denitrificans]
MAYTALFDACVLYPAPLRDLLIRTARTGAFRARWTERIHDEWIRSLIEDRPELAQKLARTRELINKAIPDCLITGYEPLEAGLELPDKDDRHVLASAICGRADVIVTYNLKDFPAECLKPYGVEAQHPDEFLRYLFDLHQPALLSAVRSQRTSLKNPPQSARQLLDTFLEQRLVATVAVLEPMIELL